MKGVSWEENSSYLGASNLFPLALLVVRQGIGHREVKDLIILFLTEETFRLVSRQTRKKAHLSFLRSRRNFLVTPYKSSSFPSWLLADLATPFFRGDNALETEAFGFALVDSSTRGLLPLL